MAKEGAPQDNGHYTNGSEVFSPVEHDGLIKSLSRPFYRAARTYNMDPEDVRQVAAEHFIRASRRYVPSDAKMETFVAHRVTGGIKDEFRERGWSLKVSQGIIRRSPRVSAATEKLTQELGRQPTEAEIAERLSISPVLVQNVRLAAAKGALRPTPLVEDDGNRESPALKSRTTDPSHTLVAEKGESAYDMVLDRMVLRDALVSLSPRQRSVINMHFGFNAEGREMSLLEIAEVYDLTESRVSQVINEALGHLRKKMKVVA